MMLPNPFIGIGFYGPEKRHRATDFTGDSHFIFNCFVPVSLESESEYAEPQGNKT